MRYVVAAGGEFLDIDAYGGIVAYAELLRHEGKAAVAVADRPLNASIPLGMRQLDVAIETNYQPQPNDSYVMIDISEPDFFAPFVDQARVVEIIDHHPGFEAYWQGKGIVAQIEFIGAACTLVYERWHQSQKQQDMSSSVAALLAAGILDNTLNFTADVTTERDHKAYVELCRIGSLSSDFAADYFAQCQQLIESDVERAIMNDRKSIQYPGYDGKLIVGQLAVWDAAALLASRERFIAIMAEQKIDVINVISICDAKSYIVSRNAHAADWFSDLLGVQFVDGIAATPRTWLRKKIMKLAIEKSGA